MLNLSFKCWWRERVKALILLIKWCLNQPIKPFCPKIQTVAVPSPIHPLGVCLLKAWLANHQGKDRLAVITCQLWVMSDEEWVWFVVLTCRSQTMDSWETPRDSVLANASESKEKGSPRIIGWRNLRYGILSGSVCSRAERVQTWPPTQALSNQDVRKWYHCLWLPLEHRLLWRMLMCFLPSGEEFYTMGPQKDCEET